ncbi:MAG: hypothetical protein DIU78_010195 [Pseudomonadota bacterium]|nr:MAG: hypothetical protein DIU78_18010 [Pseudomonadota bacterium]
MSKVKACSWVIALLLGVPSVAAAQGARESFGSRGQFVIGAERLFGLVVSSSTVDPEIGSEIEESHTSFTLLANPTNGVGNGRVSTYSFPRVGFDFLVTDGVSVGAALGMASVSGTLDTEAQPEQELDPTLAFLFAPRVGYAYPFGSTIGIWPRVGISYVTSSTSNDIVETSYYRLAVTLEAPLVISPVPHAAFTIGPVFDIGVSGGIEESAQMGGLRVSFESDESGIEWGLMAGLLVYL